MTHNAESGEVFAGCDCTELCEMGPTCPGGALAGLSGSGCHRVRPLPPELTAFFWHQHDAWTGLCQCGEGPFTDHEHTEHVALLSPEKGASPTC